jgi:hypothetical protein
MADSGDDILLIEDHGPVRVLTAERNWVPFPTGPGVTFADRTICGL